MFKYAYVALASAALSVVVSATADAQEAPLTPGGRRPPKGKTFGGTVTFDAPAHAERYYVTLSSEGWIDVVQHDTTIRPDAHTSAKECPGVRKSVRFPVGEFPTVLQVSGAPADTIKIGIRPAR